MNIEQKDILIHKWLTGRLNDREAEHFEQLALSEQEKSSLTELWDKTRLYAPPLKINREAAWRKIEATIQPTVAHTNTGSTSARKLYRIITRVAAVALLLVGSFFLWQKYAAPQSYYTQKALTAHSTLTLHDGSVVWLRKGSRLEYPSAFKGKERRVKLYGEAFFDIQKSSNRFVIETPNAEVTVLGTSFDVDTDDRKTEVTVATGVVALKSQRSGKEVKLTPNQKATYDVEAQRITVLKAPYLNDIAWHTGKLHFENTPLTEVLNTLSALFGAEILLENNSLGSCPFTSPLASSELQKTINVIAKAFDLKVEKSPQGYILKEGRCH